MRFEQLKQAASAFRRDHASRFGAALAFYIVLSIAPIAVIAITVAAMIFGRRTAEGVIFHQIAGTLGPATESAVEEMVRNSATPKVGFIATALGLVTLVFGLIGIYTQIEDALRTIWKVERVKTHGAWAKLVARVRTVALVLGVACLLFVIVSADAAIAITGKYAAHHLLGGEPLWQVLQLIVSVVVLTILAATIFRYIPIARVPWQDVLPGAAFTATFFVIGKFALGLYLRKAAVGSSYGAAGSFVVVLLWAYWSAQIFFFGLEFTHVYAARDPSLE
ncbi:MAG TPA: YihY/virulence factor BrkB family protein [Candidatus Binatia bacterium]|nr:YihY/virulence factor BrkB family protein [Candidatus Binatia bacterium]